VKGTTSNRPAQWLLAALLGPMLLTGCASSGSSSGSGAGNGVYGLGASGGTHTSGIQFSPMAVDVPASTVRSSLQSISPDGAVFSFSSSSGTLAKLQVGSIMLLEGTALRTVTAISHSGSRLVVTTGPAALTDLLTNGQLTWNTPVDPTAGFIAPADEPSGASAPTTSSTGVTAVDLLAERHAGAAARLDAFSNGAAKGTISGTSMPLPTLPGHRQGSPLTRPCTKPRPFNSRWR
jgi:hypothetical protein